MSTRQLIKEDDPNATDVIMLHLEVPMVLVKSEKDFLLENSNLLRL